MMKIQVMSAVVYHYMIATSAVMIVLLMSNLFQL